MELNCNRFKFLAHHNVEGCTQFRKTRNEILRNYCVEILKGNSAPNITDERVKKEVEEIDLDAKLEILKESVKIETETQWEDEYAYMGSINNRQALFTLSTSKRLTQSQALTPMYIKDNFMLPDDVVLATVMVIENKIREYHPQGLLTKSGIPDKRDSIGSWNTIRDKIRTLTNEYNTFITNAHLLPNPTFGECAICPYHNYKILWDGREYVCNG
jgi:hypothetical protein